LLSPCLCTLYASASNNTIIPAGRPGSRASGAIMPPFGACRVDATRIVAFRHRHDKDMHGSDGDGYITHQQATDYTKRLAFFFLRDSGVSRRFKKSQKEGYSVWWATCFHRHADNLRVNRMHVPSPNISSFHLLHCLMVPPARGWDAPESTTRHNNNQIATTSTIVVRGDISNDVIPRNNSFQVIRRLERSGSWYERDIADRSIKKGENVDGEVLPT
jgi:hypothetical protein